MSDQHDLKLIAYRVHNTPSMPIVPASIQRTWMSQTNDRFAYRCLPLTIANQHGWFILNTHKIRVVWNGGSGLDALTIVCKAGPKNTNVPAISHFGHGVLTWPLNYIFRTPPGYNLWARGPSNYTKDGIAPLEGIIETDWSVATFTMNWKMTTVNVPVDFEIGEPICMITPVKRGEAENFIPVMRDLSEEPELKKAFEDWSASRNKFNADLARRAPEAVESKWQRDYTQGVTPTGQRAADHQVKLEIRPFDGTTDKFVPTGEPRV
jgi:hypothetical protein